jgi:hypothetical protein
MTGSSSVVLGNLAYLIGAVVLAIIGGFAVWLHHRQPKSMDANLDAFQRGLQAIAPDSSRPAPVRPPAAPLDGLRVRPRSAVTLQTSRAVSATADRAVTPPAAERTTSQEVASRDEREPVRVEDTAHPTVAGDGAAERAGAETG